MCGENLWGKNHTNVFLPWGREGGGGGGNSRKQPFTLSWCRTRGYSSRTTRVGPRTSPGFGGGEGCEKSARCAIQNTGVGLQRRTCEENIFGWTGWGSMVIGSVWGGGGKDLAEVVGANCCACVIRVMYHAGGGIFFYPRRGGHAFLGLHSRVEEEGRGRGGGGGGAVESREGRPAGIARKAQGERRRERALPWNRRV